jgi:hypothetical protein
LIWTTEVDFDRPKQSKGFIPLTSGIQITHCSADFELLVKQGFVFLKLVLSRLKFDHLLPGLCIYTGMEGRCLLHHVTWDQARVFKAWDLACLTVVWNKMALLHK